jgi:hypothetical protein
MVFGGGSAWRQGIERSAEVTPVLFNEAKELLLKAKSNLKKVIIPLLCDLREM